MIRAEPGGELYMSSLWQQWSTGDTDCNPAEYWVDVIRRGVIDASLEDPDASYTAHLRSREVADCRFVTFGTTGRHRICRTAQQTRRSDDAHYMVGLQTVGTLAVGQSGERLLIAPGELVILHSGFPFELRFEEDIERKVVMIPRSMLDRFLPRQSPILRGVPIRLVPAGMTGRVATDMIRYMTDPASAWAENDCKVSVTCLAQLLTGAIMQSRLNREQEPLLHRRIGPDDIITLIRHRATEFDITPAIIARELDISLRTLHRALAAGGHTFSRCLLSARLDCALVMLQAEDAELRTMQGIAMASGFSDATHFSRTFREKFGSRPSAIRSG